MNGRADAAEIAGALVRVLEDLRIDYMVMGGLAVVCWGIPRATLDVDLAISSPDEQLLRFLRRMEDEGHVVDEVYMAGWRDRIRDMEVAKFHFKSDAQLTRVDLFPVVTGFQRSAFSRRIRVSLGRFDAWVVSAADLIVFKLLAYRNKDRADLENIVTIQGIPEPDYLDSWLERLDLVERFLPYRDR